MPKRDIEFLRINHLRGPNFWTYRPVLEAWVDIGELEDCPSNTLPGFYERLSTWLPTLVEHRCSYGEHGGFLRRVREGTWPGHILEHVTLELQSLAGMPGGFGKARETSKRGVYKVVVRAWHEQLTRACLHDARELILAAIEDRPYDTAATVARLRKMADKLCLGPSTACIVDAADDRDIPAIRLNEGNLVQLGYCAEQRRIWTAETDATSAIAEGISRDKDLTKQLLTACGVPVPDGEIVDSAEAAWEAAQDLGLPVVVKPSDGNHGRGVFTNLSSREQIETAYAVAVEEGSEVIVERFIPGLEHRLLVVGGKVVAAARGEEAFVVGDGQSTVNELLASQINSDPRRGNSEDHPLNPVRIDSAARLELERQGYTQDSVVPAGERVLVQRNGNVAFDVTDQVHPDIARTVSLAARIVGLDIAGVDLLATDIARPLEEQGGAIVEVNAGPGLLMHLKPAEGQPRPVGQAIVDNLFPDERAGRVPLVGITGTSEHCQLARLLGWLLHLSGRYTALACRDGLYLDRRQQETGDCANWHAAHKVLLNRAVQAAVLENTPESILGEGLAYDRCQVGIVTDIAEDARAEQFDILDADQMAKVLRTQVDVVLRDGFAVLNAADARVADMAQYSDGEVIFFSHRADLPVLTAHLAAGGRAVYPHETHLVWATGPQVQKLIALDALPTACGNDDTARMICALAAAATGWALGMEAELVRAGLQSFGTAGTDTFNS